MALDIPTEAQHIIDQHSFAITMAGRSYVVRDPTSKTRSRFEGPELLPLLKQAVAAKTGVDTNSAPPTSAAAPAQNTKIRGTGKKKASKAAKKPTPPATPAKPKKDDTPSNTDEPDEFEADELDDTGGKVRKAKTVAVKKTPREWVTGRIGMLILRHPEKNEAEIYAMCQASGIKTQLLTVKGLRRYFRLCLECQLAIAEESVDDA